MELYHQITWVSRLLTMDLGFFSLLNCVKLFFIINVFSISVNTLSLLVLFLWTTLTNRAGLSHIAVVVQSLSCARVYATPWTAAHQAPLSSAISQGLLKFMSFETVTI